MCGIFGYVGKKTSAPKAVLEGLKTLEYRGYDSWGFAWLENDKIIVKKTVGKKSNVKTIKSTPVRNSFVAALGHTRWATHGGVTDENAHPHTDCNDKYALVHNGIIENYTELKKALLKKGHRFKSETDTEVVNHLVEDEIKKTNSNSKDSGPLLFEAFRHSFKKLTGLNAVALLSPNNEIVLAKTGSPLCLGLGKEEYLVSSDAVAILPYTKEVIFLEDNQGALINSEGIKLYDLNSGQVINREPTHLEWSIGSSSLGKYAHYMLKEIYEQPKVLSHIVRNYKDAILALSGVVKSSYGTYIIGCGTAAHAALAGSYLFSKIASRHVTFSFGSEFIYLTNFLTPRSLVIALSQSGETIDTIDSVMEAKKRGAKIASLVNNLGSTLYRNSDYKILLGAGPEKCVCATKSYVSKLAILNLLAHALAGDVVAGMKEVSK